MTSQVLIGSVDSCNGQGCLSVMARTFSSDGSIIGGTLRGRRRVVGEIVNMDLPGVHIWTNVLCFRVDIIIP